LILSVLWLLLVVVVAATATVAVIIVGRHDTELMCRFGGEKR